MITGDWEKALKSEFRKPYYRSLFEFVKEEYSKNKIYPPKELIFNALKLTELSNVKAVIIGQDPYHNENQAMGLSFSVPKSQNKLPPSLKNIYKEIEDDIGCRMQTDGDLTYLAKQGVLLLNSTLTVRAHQANSHKNKGWEILTDAIIKVVSEKDSPIAFLLWGNSAKEKEGLLSNPKHLVLKAAHPSPLSASNGFFGCRHFSKTNEFLIRNSLNPIIWSSLDI